MSKSGSVLMSGVVHFYVDNRKFSSGVARLINKACTHCLMYGAQNGYRIIDDHMVKRVIQGEVS